MIAEVGRVLAAVAALALYALNDVRMYQTLPTVQSADRPYAAWVQMWGTGQEVYLTAADLAVRWGLAGLTLAACIWALAETFQPKKADI